jgi:ubiquinol-cytochrome c reductase cytochrome b subunit
VLLLGPIVGFTITRRVARALQRKDRELVLHGVETGRIVRLPGGEYVEVHRPLDAYERWRLVDFEDHAPLMLRPDDRGRITVLERVRVRLTRFFFEDRVRPVTRETSVEERD